MNISKERGFTVIELVVAGTIIIVIIFGVMQGLAAYDKAKRAGTIWTIGQFQNPPNIVNISPDTGQFVFTLMTGTGVDTNGQPVNVNSGLAVTNRPVTVGLWRPSPINGQIVTINGITQSSGATTGTTVTDALGMVTIIVEVDSDKTFRLSVAMGSEKEATVFKGN